MNKIRYTAQILLITLMIDMSGVLQGVNIPVLFRQADSTLAVKDISGNLAYNAERAYKVDTSDNWNMIVIHHTATEPRSPQTYALYHTQGRGWGGLGYHYMIDSAGTIFKCNDLSIVTNHTAGFNHAARAICLIGNFNETTLPAKQKAACTNLIADIKKRHTVKFIIGHREASGSKTDCPGKNVNINDFRK